MAGSWVGLHDWSCWSCTQQRDRRRRGGHLFFLRGRTNTRFISGPVQPPGLSHERGCAVAAQPRGKAAPDPPRYLHPAEVADLLHVSPKTVSRWAEEGKLPFLKTLGGHRRYPAAEIRQLAEGLRVSPQP